MTQALPHADLKDKHRQGRESFSTPLNLRVHRALSWLGRAEATGDDRDVRFILLWVGFNAAYAGDVARAAGEGERDAFRGFFETLLVVDATKRIYNIIWQRFSQEIRLLLDNRFVFAPFWAHHNGLPGYDDWSVRLERSRTAIGYALRQQDTATILSILFDRLYVLRNQLVHGGATWNSDVNRAQVRDGAALLNCLLPIFIDLHRSYDGRAASRVADAALPGGVNGHAGNIGGIRNGRFRTQVAVVSRSFNCNPVLRPPRMIDDDVRTAFGTRSATHKLIPPPTISTCPLI